MATLKSGTQSSASSSTSLEGQGETLAQLDRISRDVSRATGLSQAQVANIAFGASGSFGGNRGRGKWQGGMSTDKSYQSTLSDQEREALDSLNQEQVESFKHFADQVSNSRGYSTAVTTNTNEAQDLSARLATSASRAEQAQASLTERVAYAERMSSAYEQGESIAIDLAQDPHNLTMFMRYAEQYGGNSASAKVMMDAELVRQGLSPNRVFSDGTALPTSFGDMSVHRRTMQQQMDQQSDPANTFARQRRTVDEWSNTLPETPPASSMPIREQVQARGAQMRNQTESDQAGFDRRADLVDTEDGSLASNKSQMEQAAKQANSDARSTINRTKDAIRDLFRR